MRLNFSQYLQKILVLKLFELSVQVHHTILLIPKHDIGLLYVFFVQYDWIAAGNFVTRNIYLHSTVPDTKWHNMQITQLKKFEFFHSIVWLEKLECVVRQNVFSFTQTTRNFLIYFNWILNKSNNKKLPNKRNKINKRLTCKSK